MKPASLVKLALGVLILTAAVALPGCDSSDPTAPSGSTITLTASPNPIIGVGSSATITARIFNSNGVPVPDDTIIFFESSSGLLTKTEVTTSDGIATTMLTATSTGTITVTALSGPVTATVQVQVITASINAVTLQSSDPTIELICDDPVPLNGQVTDGNGAGIGGLQVTFQIVSSIPTGVFDGGGGGSFTNPVTNSNGDYIATFQINPQLCQNNCTGGSNCTLFIRATAGQVDSSDLTIFTNT
ncbi:MAG: Ig-like domain-containing protein [Acidobacteriota bacterium]